MEELSFEGVEAPESFKSDYLEVGNHKVVFSQVTKGVSSQKKSPYVEITVQDENEKSCSQQYYLNGGAWNISRSHILTLVMAANSVDADGARSLLVGLNTENIDQKLSSLLIGRKIGITLNGEWVNPEDATKKSWKKAVFGNYKFAVPLSEFNTLSDKEYVKGAPDNRAANGGSDVVSTDGAIAPAPEAW